MAQEITVLYIHMNYKITTLIFQLGIQRLSRIAWSQQNILAWFTLQENNIFNLILLFYPLSSYRAQLYQFSHFIGSFYIGRSLIALGFSVQISTVWLLEKSLVNDFKIKHLSPQSLEISAQRELWIYIEFLQCEIQCEVRFRNLVQIYLSSFFWNVYVEKCTEQDTTECIKL